MDQEIKEEREFQWKKKRSGKLTASILNKIILRGKDYKKTETAKNVLWSITWERRTGKVMHSVHSSNFDWGHDNEPVAIEWVRSQFPLNEIKDCSKDYDEIQFREQLDGCGDSPDADLYGFDGKIEGIIEVKCPINEGKIEMNRGRSELTDKNEYYWQCINHFIGTPEAKYVLFVEYDAYNNEGNIVKMMRDDYINDIEFLKKALTKLNLLINMAVAGQFKF